MPLGAFRGGNPLGRIVGISDKWSLLPQASLRGNSGFEMHFPEQAMEMTELWKAWKAKKPLSGP